MVDSGNPYVIGGFVPHRDVCKVGERSPLREVGSGLVVLECTLAEEGESAHFFGALSICWLCLICEFILCRQSSTLEGVLIMTKGSM